MSQKAAHHHNPIKELVLADILTAGRFILNLVSFVVFIVLVLEMKSLLHIDIFPNYNFPIDEMVKDFF